MRGAAAEVAEAAEAAAAHHEAKLWAAWHDAMDGVTARLIAEAKAGASDEGMR
jgi:hypothetical protein